MPTIKKVSVHGDLDSVQDALRILREKGWEIREGGASLFCDVPVTLNHDGTNYFGKISIEKFASRANP